MDNYHLSTPEYKISVILLEILEKLKEEPIANKLKCAKVMAGNDLICVMQYVLPVVMQVELDVLKLHGYDDNKQSVMKFTQLVQQYEEIDSAIRNLHQVLKSHYITSFSSAA